MGMRMETSRKSANVAIAVCGKIGYVFGWVSVALDFGMGFAASSGHWNTVWCLVI